MLNQTDVGIIRNLAARVAEIAAQPVQEEKRALWRKLNARQPIRPMVMMDQVCWHELNGGGELTLQCTDPECRGYEDHLRRILYQWRHFPVDRVVENFIPVYKAIHNTGFGIGIREEITVGDPTNSVVAHKYENQFETEADLAKIQEPRISHDTTETARRLAVGHELFDGLLAVRAEGCDPYLSLWDPISMWMGVENALYAIIDRPEFMHRLLARLTTVSPEMFQEFEIDFPRRICERFGLVYYGCCDPLDGKMAEVRQLPNVRKVSMSPWANEERGAAEIHGDFVFSRKPNPAFVATEHFNPAQVREDLLATRKVCDKYGCPLEFILKDISTVCYEPQRLSEWARIAMQVVGG